jgi:hypothetical protein
MPVKANSLTLGKDKDTQNKNQLRKDKLVGLSNDANTVIDANVDKCNMCSQLEVQVKSDAELNRVRRAGTSYFPDYASDSVWVKLEEKNREGLVR